MEQNLAGSLPKEASGKTTHYHHISLYAQRFSLAFCRIFNVAIKSKASSFAALLHPYHTYFFVDDTLLLGHATTEEAQHFRFAINLYEKVSRQQVNLDKSGIVFSRDVDVDQSTVADILHILGFKKVDSHGKKVDSHGKYLGLPSIVGRNKKEIFGHIRDRIWHCIQGWSRHNFSKADKKILIKSVLQAIPSSYAMSYFEFTENVITDIQSMISNFWWGRSRENKTIHWVAWDKMARSKTIGGLGFCSFRALNMSLLSKQAWRIITYLSTLLAQVYKAKYFNNCSFMEASLGHRPLWAWRSILDSRRVLKLGCLRRIYSGCNTKIVGNCWLPEPRSPHPLLSLTPSPPPLMSAFL
ncbi:hypothetical protein DH2020_013350 [Rehmannia glutinosa]|uniref:RNA-directed DNA polymerase n=1 Tax=Rehmannia glutinosa TaxID=99300 RepID=A0ABR0X293_REHGL